MNTERRLSSARVSHALRVPSITVGLALLAVYVIWGSTYLAVRLAVILAGAGCILLKYQSEPVHKWVKRQ